MCPHWVGWLFGISVSGAILKNLSPRQKKENLAHKQKVKGGVKKIPPATLAEE